VHTPHLASLGAVSVPRAGFLAEVEAAVRAAPAAAAWPATDRTHLGTRSLAAEAR